MDSGVFVFFLPVILAFMMMGLGLELTVKDFLRVGRYPKAIFLALFCQLVILTSIAFFICVVLDLEPLLAVGLMLLAASPGGPTANLLSYLFKGDVALNLTLTAINSVITTFTLPFIVNLSLHYFMQSDTAIGIQADKFAYIFLIVFIPVCIGLLVRHYYPHHALKCNRPMRLLSILFLIAIFLYALFRERSNVVLYFVDVGIAVGIFCFSSMFIGYLVPHLAGLTERQSRACAFEIGIHNTAISITIAISVLSNTTIAIPAGVYSIFMYLFAFGFGFILTRNKPNLISKQAES